MRPASCWSPSPNYKKVDNGAARSIKCIILHATATKGLESPLKWLCSPESKVSAHYLIDEDGKIFNLVDEQNVAWHAGAAEWKGLKNINAASIGIEMVHPNDGKTPWAASQVSVCAELCACICKDYQLPQAFVVSHAEVAMPPGRKNDPLCFPWETFRTLLKEEGIE